MILAPVMSYSCLIYILIYFCLPQKWEIIVQNKVIFELRVLLAKWGGTDGHIHPLLATSYLAVNYTDSVTDLTSEYACTLIALKLIIADTVKLRSAAVFAADAVSSRDNLTSLAELGVEQTVRRSR